MLGEGSLALRLVDAMLFTRSEAGEDEKTKVDAY